MPVGAPDTAMRAATPSRPDYMVWLAMRTRNRDTDQFGHVNHAAMATIFEESRIALIFDPAFAEETAAVDLLVARLTMNFHQEMRAPADIEVGAKVVHIGSSSLIIIQGLFLGDRCFASAEAVCVLLSQKTRKPARVSDVLRAHLLA